MAVKCSLLDDCGFLKKSGRTDDMGCTWFIREYCRGPRMAECRRRKHFYEHGMLPSDDMLPTGGILTRQSD